ncbi:hypothetical protein JR316_0000359 [Psilocybe cubensis]|uniref:Uncharacterized protein n=1 Tax=Psilocybe cubensis TaxID=181762 RepID=A0ACB8HE61_PSICU|nr:hypothetical protein JR316_0000359 [Psilocybe cubensis]KAH9486295.1 hypothetical protein JR316_0000359 [Psilocybe cubensis]
MTLLQNVRHRTLEEHRRQKVTLRDELDTEDCLKDNAVCKREVPGEGIGEGRKGKMADRVEADSPGEIVVRELVARQRPTSSETLKPSNRALTSLSTSSTASAPGSSASLGSANDNNTSATTSGLQTGTIIGIIAGSIAALMVLGAVISFFLRRLRTKRRGDEIFNASEFRRSAVLLEEKKPDVRPRPPSMIERRNVQGTPSVVTNSLPPPPSMAYPYSDRAIPPSPSVPPSLYGGNGSDNGHNQQHYAQYGTAGAHFGNLPSPAPPPSAGGMYNGPPPPGAFGAHYDQAGYGAPPVPGTYAPGAYAPYGQDTRYQQMQYYQQRQQQNYQFAGYQQQHPHPVQYGPGPQSYPAGYGAGHHDPQPYHAGYGTGHTVPQMSNNPSLANSFVQPAVAQSASSVSTTPSTGKQNLHLASAPDDVLEGASGSGLRRQDTQSSGAPPAYVDETGESNKYRDVKMRPVVMNPPAESSTAQLSTPSTSAAAAGVTTATSNPAPAASTAQKRTSTRSTYSLYDQDDIYGGI